MLSTYSKKVESQLFDQMSLVLYECTTIQEFLALTESFLLENEAENGTLLGRLVQTADILAYSEKEGQIVFAAINIVNTVSPRGLMISRDNTGLQSVDKLFRYLESNGKLGLLKDISGPIKETEHLVRLINNHY